jgi:hypothetical protein
MTQLGLTVQPPGEYEYATFSRSRDNREMNRSRTVSIAKDRTF